jgi:hypothetical protein
MGRFDNLEKCCGGAINPENLMTFQRAMQEYAVFMDAARQVFAEREVRRPTWTEVSADRFNEMLGVLPPAHHLTFGFLVGEAYTHRKCHVSKRTLPAYRAYIERGQRYYTCSEPLTIPEFREVLPHEIIISIPVAENAS